MTGCDGQTTHLDDFFFNSDLCYKTCYDTPTSSWTPSGVIENAVRFNINPIGPPTGPTALTSPDSCPANTVASRTFLAYHGSASPSETPLAGWAFELNYVQCEYASYVAVCLAQGSVLADGTCSLNKCGAIANNYAAVVSAFSEPIPAGQPCYQNCYVSDTACVGYVPDVPDWTYVPMFSNDYSSLVECETANTCGQAGSAAPAISYASSGLLVCGDGP